MNKALLEELLKQPPAEPPLTEAQLQEIDRRIAEHERDPSRASSCDEVQARLQVRFGKV